MKIFLDTSYIFKVLRFVSKFWYSNLIFFNKLVNWKIILISDYVIQELLQSHILLKLWYDDVQKFLYFLHNFLSKFWIEIFESKDLKEKYLQYVNDKNDAQILQDAIESWCNVLLTNNVKDFKVDLIEKNLWIKIVKKL